MTTRRKAKLPRRACENVTMVKEDESNSNDDKQCANTDVELTFDVLTIIFKNLNGRDLCNAAVVCRCWNEAAENEKRMRGAVTSLTDLDDSWLNTEEFFNHLRIRPVLGLMFTRPFDERHPAKKDPGDCPCKFLPSRCPNIIVGNTGVVKDATELEDNPEKAALMLLPHHKDVTIETICMPTEESNKANASTRQQRMAKSTVRKLSMAKNKVKCFILLTHEHFSSALDILVQMPRDQERTVSGGIVSSLAVCKKDKDGEMCCETMAWIAVMISGPSVRSWSAVIKRSCNTREKIVGKLNLLRKQVQLRKHSMGFMFACQGRGEYMLGEKNVESTAFKELFPEVPLIGSFGGGEYGDSTIAYQSTSPSIFHGIYDCHLRLNLNLGITEIWRLYDAVSRR